MLHTGNIKKSRSPIYYVNLTGQIKELRSKKVIVVIYKGFVVKGTEEQIKASERVKKKFLLRYLKTYKKVKDFDLNRLRIIKIEIINSLGYGTPV